MRNVAEIVEWFKQNVPGESFNVEVVSSNGYTHVTFVQWNLLTFEHTAGMPRNGAQPRYKIIWRGMGDQLHGEIVSTGENE